jgi:hypothetical protein
MAQSMKKFGSNAYSRSMEINMDNNAQNDELIYVSEDEDDDIIDEYDDTENSIESMTDDEDEEDDSISDENEDEDEDDVVSVRDNLDYEDVLDINKLDVNEGIIGIELDLGREYKKEGNNESKYINLQIENEDVENVENVENDEVEEDHIKNIGIEPPEIDERFSLSHKDNLRTINAKIIDLDDTNSISTPTFAKYTMEDYKKMSLKDLRMIAKNKNLEDVSKLTKNEIIKLL